MLTRGGWFTLPPPHWYPLSPSPLKSSPSVLRGHLETTYFLWPRCPALCLAFQLFAYHNHQWNFIWFTIGWVSLALASKYSHVFSEMGSLSSFKQQMLAPLCSLDNLEELYNFLAQKSNQTPYVYPWGCRNSHLQAAHCVKPFWEGLCNPFISLWSTSNSAWHGL